MKKKNIIISVVLVLIAVIYTILVKNVDLGAIGPENSVVGFSSINKAFADFVGVNMKLYDISEYLGYLPLLMAGLYGLFGLKQLITRKSLFKVDKEIFALGVFYVVVVAMYVLFEVVIINYRPTLIEGELEASYPSSHTLMSLCICGSAIIINLLKYKGKYSKYINICSLILMLAIVLLRLFSGVHWLTDIVGGVVISSCLLYIFYSVISNFDVKKVKKAK